MPTGISSDPKNPTPVGVTFQIAGTVDPSTSAMCGFAGCYSKQDNQGPYKGTPVNPPPQNTDWALNFGPVQYKNATYGIQIQAVAGGVTTSANVYVITSL
jgi:hypothetical protein